MKSKIERNYFFLRITLPTFLAFALFVITLFVVVIPSFENQMMDRKREMTKELTNSAWNILNEYHIKEMNGELAREEAQKRAIEIINDLRYGEENKDYFWITDSHPNMIAHPYRPELNGKDLSDYSDPEGKKLFVEFVKAVQSNGNGFVNYMWQWKDDSTRIVPKLSYVKGFESWDWIIGTGIYIEDVKEEISNFTSNLFYISMSILAVLALLLLVISQQSHKIELKRKAAEDNLRESEAKYHALVEASTEGLVMILDSKFVYSNKAMQHLLSINSIDNINEELADILCDENSAPVTANFFASLLKGNCSSNVFDGKLVTKNGEILDVHLDVSPIVFGEKEGFTIIIKDVSTSKKIENELGESEEKYKTLTNNIRMGVFRITLGKKNKLLEINPAGAELLGYSTSAELLETDLFDSIRNEEDRRVLVADLMNYGNLRNRIIPFNRKDSSGIILSISAVAIKNETGESLQCDGIMEDVTERLKLEEARENLITELQTSHYFLNEPISKFIKNIISCSMETSVKEAAELMTKKKYSAILITSPSDTGNEFIGILTDRDLRERAVATGVNLDKPVYEVMTSPIISIDEDAMVFEAFSKMFEKSTRHLAVKDYNGKIISLISSEELLQVQSHSSTFLIDEIENSNAEEIPSLNSRLPVIVKTMVNNGAKVNIITKTITSIADTIMRQYILSAVEELGEPPVPFSFFALGSQGREEQTLFTDQDNAIIFDDKLFPASKDTYLYFSRLGEIVCRNMKECGYEYCIGESMANNSKWVQPISKWKDYYSHWIHNSTPQDLLEISIFFDFRSVYGEQTLAEELRDFLFQTAQGQSGFFQHLTKNCLLHKPPLNLLGNIVLESKGEHPETFNIKNAIMPLTDFARIYSLNNRVTATNTLERLRELNKRGVLKTSSYEELIQAYNFLMQLRLKHQVNAFEKNILPNNAINPNEFTQIEMKIVKNVLSQITAVQKRLSYEFTGEAL